MNIKRFYAATAREALAKARMAFGDGTLILSNRPTEDGVEVVATAEDALNELEIGAPAATSQRASKSLSRLDDEMPLQPEPRRKSALAARAELQDSVSHDTEQLAMSTLSFQDYVRERMLRRRHEALNGGASSLDSQPMPAPAAPVVARHNPLQHLAASEAKPSAQEMPRRRNTVQATAASAPVERGLLNELHSMKELIEERFNTLSWLGQARQNPIQSNLMLKLIRAGYSPALARTVLERLPEDLNAQDAQRWLMGVLERNLRTDAKQPALYEEGGIFALVGATGVGKTTTAAKMAAMCARIHGPQSVGLITLDTYRIGAHDQLRSYGRMLGIVAHLAHDQAALQDLLGLLSGKKMVLIDTSGVAPRDPRKNDMLDVLDLPHVKRLLVLNAGCHGDTLDDVVGGFKTTGSQQAVLSKVDEAVKLGPALDALIRHQMTLRGVTNGQRVPEDWESANAQQLIEASMRPVQRSAHDPKVSELNFFFTPSDMTGERSLVDA